MTLAAIAAELNAHGYRTRRGKGFHKTSVMRLVQPAKLPFGKDISAQGFLEKENEPV